MTKLLLDRPPDRLLPEIERLRLLEGIATEEGFALALANRGTYLEVARALTADGLDPGFVLGSDKLPQLSDPSFYPDGGRGVEATFSQLRLHVVPRGEPVDRDDVNVLDPSVVFARGEPGNLSATQVRRRITEGLAVDDLVPPLVARALGGYTEPSKRE